MVPGVNFTFAEASNSAASESEIQSDGGFDILQDRSTAAGPASAGALLPPEEDSVLSPELEALSPELESGSLIAARLAVPPPERSLRAHPLPL